MALIPVKGLGEVGLVTDRPFHELPLNAWTAALNVRFRNGAVEKYQGHREVFAGALNPPYFLLPVSYGGTFFWVYAGLLKVGATDMSAHGDISRAVGGNYGTDALIGWTGGVIEDVPVLNNSVDDPQMWNKPALATKLTALTGWNPLWKARTLRVYKRYLVALDVTKSGVRTATMIKWSHQAPTGNVPQSWDETDPTKDAGEYSLPGEGGYLIDLKTLRDDAIVYKEYQTWKMQYVGGIAIFRFTKLFGELGMLNRRCVTEFLPGRHFVFAGDDCVVHDGQSAQSMMDERAKALLTATLDTNAVSRAFVVPNFQSKEILVGLPEAGQTVCTKALVWNWLRNDWTVRELPSVAHAEAGLVSPPDPTETWAGAVGIWDTDVTAWGDRSFDPTKRGVLMAAPGVSKFYQMDFGGTFAGTNISAYIERQGIGFPLKANQPPDYMSNKQVMKIWPQITGTPGGIVNVSLGTQKKLGGPVSYLAPRPFVIGTTEFCDFSSSPAARLHALKFDSNTSVDWKLQAYDAEVVFRGMHGS